MKVIPLYLTFDRHKVVEVLHPESTFAVHGQVHRASKRAAKTWYRGTPHGFIDVREHPPLACPNIKLRVSHFESFHCDGIFLLTVCTGWSKTKKIHSQRSLPAMLELPGGELC